MKNHAISPRRSLIAGAIAVACLAGFGVSSARAVDASFSVSGVGTADFTFLDSTHLQLVITNTGTGTLQGTSISGLEFKASGFTLGALTSATATDGMISSPYSAITSGTAGTDILTADGGRWHTVSGPSSDPNELTALGGGQPSEMIISNSISSNGGTSNFDPYVSQVGTYIYSVSNVGGSPSFGDANGNVIFLLGTNPDSTPASGGCVGADCGGTGSGTPEPASLGILGLGAAGMLLRRRKA